MTQLTDEQYSRWAAEKVMGWRYVGRREAGGRTLGIWMDGKDKTGFATKNTICFTAFDPRNNAEQALDLLRKWTNSNPRHYSEIQFCEGYDRCVCYDGNDCYVIDRMPLAECVCAAIYQAVEGE